MSLAYHESLSRPPSVHPEAIEEDLIDFFPELVAKLGLEHVGVKLHKERPIGRPKAYGFLALAPCTGYEVPPSKTPRTLMSSGHINLARINPDISSYRPGSRAFLDTWQAIGLTYDQKLIAVGGAGIDDFGRVKITQLQDVTDVRKGGRGGDYYRTGMHNGLRWRHTLVKAWEQIGNELGAEQISIQSSRNTSYGAVAAIPEHFTVTNDQVADQMGYDQNPQSYDWYRSLVDY